MQKKIKGKYFIVITVHRDDVQQTINDMVEYSESSIETEKLKVVNVEKIDDEDMVIIAEAIGEALMANDVYYPTIEQWIKDKFLGDSSYEFK